MQKFVTIMSVLCVVTVGVFAILALVFTSGGQALPQSSTIEVDIPGQGKVLGNHDTTRWTNQQILQFRGIPFAESPSGSRRFKPPVPRSPWKDTFNATQHGIRCPVVTSIKPQNETKGIDLEDCLSLCVYTKQLTGKRPVMLYVYGGGFYNGTASDFSPNYLLEKNIVLVVPQYRIGALGWLTTYSEAMPGNAPLGDILLALEWVQRNIHVFGGDAKQVTIFGQSAGACVTSALLLSPKTPNQHFHRAITQSGSILAKWGITREPQLQAVRICQQLNCSNCTAPLASEDCLLKASVHDLLKAQKNESFAPVVGDLQGILPKHPAELAENFTRNISLMTGYTKHDGSFVLASLYDVMKQTLGNSSRNTVRQFAHDITHFGDADDSAGLTEQLLQRSLFTQKLLDSTEHKEAIPSYFDLITDIAMKGPINHLATKILRKQQAPVFVYSFDYEGQHTFFGYGQDTSHYPFNGGVHHSNDYLYLFEFFKLNANDTKMAKNMVEMWTSFAINGTPSTVNGTALKNLKTEGGPYNRFNTEVTIGFDLLEQFTAALDDPHKDKLIKKNVEF